MKTKLIGLLFLITAISFQTKAQYLTETEIIGTWKVVKVNILSNDEIPKDKKSTLESLKKAFLKSRFKFKEDKNFSFDFDFEDMKIKKGRWKFDKSTKSFIIQEWKDKDTNHSLLMGIIAKKEGGKILFTLEESFIELEMKKE